MEIRNDTALSSSRQVSATRRGDERRSREGEWQPAPARRETPAEEPARSDGFEALRGRWVVDARREPVRAAADEGERSREMRRRLEETYRPPAATAATRPAAADPLDLVV